MSSYQFGDIYLMRFHPACGRELKRYRPAVITSSLTNRIDPRFTSVCPLSTQVDDLHSEVEFVLEQDTKCLEQKSVLIAWYIRTVDVKRLQTKIGALLKKDRQKLKHRLKKLHA